MPPARPSCDTPPVRAYGRWGWDEETRNVGNGDCDGATVGSALLVAAGHGPSLKLDETQLHSSHPHWSDRLGWSWLVTECGGSDCSVHAGLSQGLDPALSGHSACLEGCAFSVHLSSPLTLSGVLSSLHLPTGAGLGLQERVGCETGDGGWDYCGRGRGSGATRTVWPGGRYCLASDPQGALLLRGHHGWGERVRGFKTG